MIDTDLDRRHDEALAIQCRCDASLRHGRSQRAKRQLNTADLLLHLPRVVSGVMR